ncbi:paraben-hydrolyzing esterase precursor [Pseudovirgaria hyperparasitica]|uniref:Carboxylic ester hydrolase n=1 Tax=Pseudovirgaria hyperparasitica TaxID=470096 RepID=A0A6A6W6U9_9PEZI|nr:paraben-hydrolyzing esterase precursor [Pseudovirgaria hyperparasitica]KAF2757754.1 paraben-hydrolyzing esterase precursor [Pseudovirgaria hyperparasitica]
MSSINGVSSKPYVLDLQYRGFIEGVTLTSDIDSTELCHFFGGIPDSHSTQYGLPPIGPFRWRRPRPLPPCYRYGTRANPGKFTGGTATCPQPRAAKSELALEVRDEDCLQLNVWLPVGEPPEGGWPVIFYIRTNSSFKPKENFLPLTCCSDGGFLQFGDPNDLDVSKLLSETDCRCIFVMPAYRLNVFGFLASRELLRESGAGCEVGNLGFWDQRLALEWAWKNIDYFGGNPKNIAVAGYSAGMLSRRSSYSTFMQLQYDLFLPDQKSIIRRAIMWSNGPGVQPKSLLEAQEQFDELLQVLGISLDITEPEKLSKLRQIPSSQLVEATFAMKIHQFRAVTDGEFVRPSLFEDIDRGEFATRMRKRGVQLMMGECKDEHFVYGEWRPPEDSFQGLYDRLQADYPRAACDALVKHFYPNGQLPSRSRDWCEEFGRIYADIQIHAMERGLANALDRFGAGDLVYRYRVEWRAKCVALPPEWGVTHTSDLAIWFWGDKAQLEDEEKTIAYESFVHPLSQFITGRVVSWGTQNVCQSRTLKADGSVEILDDADWERSLAIWRCLQAAGAAFAPIKGRL